MARDSAFSVRKWHGDEEAWHCSVCDFDEETGHDEGCVARAPEPRDEAPRWRWERESKYDKAYLYSPDGYSVLFTEEILEMEPQLQRIVDTLNAGEEAREWGKEYADGDLIERGELDEARTERDALQERVTVLETALRDVITPCDCYYPAECNCDWNKEQHAARALAGTGASTDYEQSVLLRDIGQLVSRNYMTFHDALEVSGMESERLVLVELRTRWLAGTGEGATG